MNGHWFSEELDKYVEAWLLNHKVNQCLDLQETKVSSNMPVPFYIPLSKECELFFHIFATIAISTSYFKILAILKGP